MKKIFLRNILWWILFGLSFVVTIFVFVRAAWLTATNWEPLTVSKWTDMAANFFWWSGSWWIYYNGNVWIWTNSPNKNLHIYDTTNNAEIDLQSVVWTNKHWAIYQDKTNQNLYMWNWVNKVNITTWWNMDVLW